MFQFFIKKFDFYFVFVNLIVKIEKLFILCSLLKSTVILYDLEQRGFLCYIAVLTKQKSCVYKAVNIVISGLI